MPEEVRFLDVTRTAVDEVFKILERGNEQADVRDKAIETLNNMCDALQAGADFISKELSSIILEFHQVPPGDPGALQAFFERTVARLGEPHLRLLLHEGKVCGQLHSLGDRFAQPFSPQTRAGAGILDLVNALFRRSSSMSEAIDGLVEGERNYLRDFSAFLNDVVDLAEQSAGAVWGDPVAAHRHAEQLVTRVRQKRAALQRQILGIREIADTAIAKLV